jgi:hypothetical protein
MLYACVQRFDVTGNLKFLAKFLASKRCLNPGEGNSETERVNGSRRAFVFVLVLRPAGRPGMALPFERAVSIRAVHVCSTCIHIHTPIHKYKYKMYSLVYNSTGRLIPLLNRSVLKLPRPSCSACDDDCSVACFTSRLLVLIVAASGSSLFLQSPESRPSG